MNPELFDDGGGGADWRAGDGAGGWHRWSRRRSCGRSRPGLEPGAPALEESPHQRLEPGALPELWEESPHRGWSRGRHRGVDRRGLEASPELEQAVLGARRVAGSRGPDLRGRSFVA